MTHHFTIPILLEAIRKWNPRYMYEDPTFLLEFAPLDARRIAYAASFGDTRIDSRYAGLYQRNLFEGFMPYLSENPKACRLFPILL